MSTGWLGRRWGLSEGSVIARHEVSRKLQHYKTSSANPWQWKGLSKLRNKLEDYGEKQRSERAERAQRRARRREAMPGSFEPESPVSPNDASDDDVDMEDLY